MSVSVSLLVSVCAMVRMFIEIVQILKNSWPKPIETVAEPVAPLWLSHAPQVKGCVRTVWRAVLRRIPYMLPASGCEGGTGEEEGGKAL